MFSHGIEVDAQGKAIWLRFGFLRLLHHLQGTASEQANMETDLRRRFGSNRFMLDVQHFQSCFWRLERAAGNVERCRQAIAAYAARDISGGPIHMSDKIFVDHHDAVADVQLYLDMIFVYLRIQADAFAQIIPAFYKRASIIPRHSFREQCKWFTERRSNFDPAYSEILRKEMEWFTQLADEGSLGLRNAIVHGGAIHQLGWTTTQEPFSIELQLGLWSKTGWIEEDLNSAIRTVISGWCRFLDAVFEHFVFKFKDFPAVGDGNNLSRLMECSGGELRSFWVFPRATGS